MGGGAGRLAGGLGVQEGRAGQVDLRQDVLDAAAARALAQQGIEREVAPRKL